jgi:hypothetical protein
VRPGAHAEYCIGGEIKPTTQEEIWKHASYDHRRRNECEYLENNRHSLTNLEPACDHDDIVGIQCGHESMLSLQDSIEEEKSKVVGSFSRKKYRTIVVLSIAIFIFATIALILKFTIIDGKHVSNGNDGTLKSDIDAYSLFDFNL